jgi:hypothetical protein
MPRFTLIRFDRYEAAKSTIHYHDTHETNLGLAFQEALAKLWNLKNGFGDFDMKRIIGYGNKIGLDFEEVSYLFFEG